MPNNLEKVYSKEYNLFKVVASCINIGFTWRIWVNTYIQIVEFSKESGDTLNIVVNCVVIICLMIDLFVLTTIPSRFLRSNWIPGLALLFGLINDFSTQFAKVSINREKDLLTCVSNFSLEASMTGLVEEICKGKSAVRHLDISIALLRDFCLCAIYIVSAYCNQQTLEKSIESEQKSFTRLPLATLNGDTFD